MKLQALLSISTLFAFYASALPAQNWQDLGYGTNGANGRVPQHTVVGGAVGKYIEFKLNADPNSQAAWLAMGFTQIRYPWLGTILLPSPDLVIAMPMSNGMAMTRVPVPSIPSLAGLPIYSQCLVAESAFSLVLSNAVGGRLYRYAAVSAQLPAQNGLVDGAEVFGVRPGLEQHARSTLMNYTPLDQLDRIGAGHVLPHSGQAFLEIEDLALPGRDDVVGTRILRRHMSRTSGNNAHSVFGPGWAFNYDYTLVRSGADVIVTGFGRVDRFVQNGIDQWVGTDGNYGLLTYNTSGSYNLRLPHGTTMVFLAEGNVGRLVQVVSPNSNRLQLQYSTSGPLLQRKLLRIIDSYEMSISFDYRDSRFPRQVTKISDYAGREVQYIYNSSGDLTNMISPAVRSTQGLNDFRNGKRTRYTYSGSHMLASVIRPLEVAAGLNEAAMSWTYFATGDFAGWVKSFTLGNDNLGARSAGGTFGFSYEFLPIFTSSPAPQAPVVRVIVYDRRGTKTMIECNRLGQMLLEQVFTNLGVRSNVPSSYTRRFEYNSDGELTVMSLPNGNSSAYSYPASSALRASQGNCLREVRTPGPLAGAQSKITSEVVYEPVMNSPFKVIGSRGFVTGQTKSEFTTTFILDYMEGLTSSRARQAVKLGITAAALQVLYSAAGITDLLGDVNGDGTVSMEAGNVIVVKFPHVTLPSQASRIALASAQTAQQLLRFNLVGQLVAEVDAEENVTEYEYYGADQINGDGITRVPSASTTTGGYIKRIHTDSQYGAGRQSGQNSVPTGRKMVFEYGPQDGGRLPGNLLGIPTSILDARGIKRVRLVNELGQVVEDIRAYSVSPGLVALKYVQTSLRDANDDIVSMRQTTHDPRTGGRGMLVFLYEYDVLGNRTRVMKDVGGLNIIDDYAYDANSNNVRKTRAAFKSEQIVDKFQYDARDLVSRWTKAAGKPEAAVFSNDVDGNGNIVASYDANRDVQRNLIDGFDRTIETIDRVGNTVRIGYDAHDNMVSELHYGPVSGSSSTHSLLAATYGEFDSRDREYRTDQRIFHYASRTIGRIDGGALYPNDGNVSEVQVFDRLGRAVAHIDANDNLTRLEYNGSSDLVRRYDPDATNTWYLYDANGNPTIVLRTESGIVAQNERFEWLWTYDALNRVTQIREPNGQTTFILRDENGRDVRRTDWTGDMVDQDFDALSRQVLRRTYLASGSIVSTQAYDAVDNMVSSSDGLNQTTRYKHDALGHVVSILRPDATTESRRWNGDGDLLAVTDQNGSVRSFTYDAESRLIRAATTRANGVVGSTLQQFQYDGRHRQVRLVDNNDPSTAADDVALEFWYDSLGRVIRESQQLGATQALTIDSQWQGDSRRVGITYPNGRAIGLQYDAGDRLKKIFEGSSTVFSRSYLGQRPVYTSFGNGVRSDLRSATGSSISGRYAGYDKNGRPVRESWSASTRASLADYRHRYDGVAGVGSSQRIAEIRVHLGSESDSFGYDKANRMVTFTTAKTSSVVSSRTLDGASNAQSLTVEGVNLSPVVGGWNRYVSFSNTTRTHDRNGNLTRDDRYEYGYDGQNRLVEVKKNSGTVVQDIVYDALGRRVQMRIDSTDMRMVQDGDRLLEERSSNGTVVRQYVWAQSGEPVQLITSTGSLSTYYFLTTTTQDVGALVDANQNVADYYTYGMLGAQKIFGANKQRSEVSVTGNPIGYRGMFSDNITGLLYSLGNTRVYSPHTGRCLQMSTGAEMGAQNNYGMSGLSIQFGGVIGLPSKSHESSGFVQFAGSLLSDLWDQFKKQIAPPPCPHSGWFHGIDDKTPSGFTYTCNGRTYTLIRIVRPGKGKGTKTPTKKPAKKPVKKPAKEPEGSLLSDLWDQFKKQIAPPPCPHSGWFHGIDDKTPNGFKYKCNGRTYTHIVIKRKPAKKK